FSISIVACAIQRLFVWNSRKTQGLNQFVTEPSNNGQGQRKVWCQLRLRGRNLRQGEWQVRCQLRLRSRNLRKGERQVRGQLRLRCRNLCQGIDHCLHVLTWDRIQFVYDQ
ncbi:hypothetical protein M758_1G181500, partial [Ceratodon purpureus]